MIKLKSSRGFTLLEVLIVLVILAVLAGLAVPAYISAVEKSRKQEAITSLGAVRSSQMRYYAQNSAFATSFAQMDFDPTLAVVGNTVHFTYSVVSGGATMVAQATRNALDIPSGVPTGYTIRITETGVITSQY